MTNNPTIDGVSRELIARAVTAAHIADCPSLRNELRALLDAPSNDLREHCKQCAEIVKTWPEWKQNCLGGGPVVERQECVTFPRDLTDEMAEAIALRANCCGGIADDVWEALVQCVEKPKFPDIEVCGSWPVQSEPRPRLSSLQSTIAQLQARITQLESEAIFAAATHQAARDRITELESGRGEPVAYADPIAFENFKNHAHKGGAYLHEWMWAHPLPSLIPLYTAPPAPVAVVLPERMYSLLPGADYWNACLDATAALNGVKK